MEEEKVKEQDISLMVINLWGLGRKIKKKELVIISMLTEEKKDKNLKMESFQNLVFSQVYYLFSYHYEKLLTTCRTSNTPSLVH